MTVINIIGLGEAPIYSVYSNLSYDSILGRLRRGIMIRMHINLGTISRMEQHRIRRVRLYNGVVEVTV